MEKPKESADAKKEYKCDWLNLRPVFYNEKTCTVGNSIEEATDFRNFDWDPVGLHYMLNWGYCVFGRTPVKNVKFLLPGSKLVKDDQGRIAVELDHESGLLALLEQSSSPENVIEMTREHVQNWQKESEKPIIVPFSGGFDSRFLAAMLAPLGDSKAFTYGAARNQNKCREVVRARFAASKLGMPWARIEIGRFHKYLDKQFEIMGASALAAGAYHYEFYDAIIAQGYANARVLSGIVGDAWAGKFVPQVAKPEDVRYLALTYEMKADPGFLTNPPKSADVSGVVEDYLDFRRDNLKSNAYRVIELIRFKMMLLRFIYAVPESLGLSPFSPFTDQKIVAAMLTLPAKERENRKWQVDFFRKHGLNIEELSLKYQKLNFSNHNALNKVTPGLLDPGLLKEIVRPEYVERLNLFVQKKRGYLPFVLRQNFNNLRNRIGLGLRTDMGDYFAYLTLYPLEQLIKRRNAGAPK